MGLRFSKLDNSIATFKVINTAIDPDAQAFIIATGISGTNASAINTLVVDLKAASIWTKMKAIYPMVGGTATTHKYNLINPQDTNAAFRLSFVGGWTHSANGALPNGTNAYANTFLNPNNSAGIILPSSAHLSYYSRTTIVGVTYEIGGGNTAANESLALKVASNFTAGNINIPVNFTTTTDAKGFWAGSKRANNDRECYRNGISQNTITSNDTLAFSSIFISLGAFNNNGSIIGYSAKECAFASIGAGLTDAQSLAFYNAVQTFQITLGRQV